MLTPVQVFRREAEVGRYPQLAAILVARDEQYCRLMQREWQSHVLSALEVRKIAARTEKPLAYVNLGQWGPWAHTNDWAIMATAVFKNEASMLSWVIETGHLDGDFVHSQCCILAMFCECLHRSIPLVLTRRKQQ